MGLRIIDKKNREPKVDVSVLEEEAKRIFAGSSQKSIELRSRFLDAIKSRRADTLSTKTSSLPKLLEDAVKTFKENPDQARASQASVGIATLLDLL